MPEWSCSMKKLYRIILILLAALMVLSGCEKTNKNSSDSSSSPSAESAAGESKPADEENAEPTLAERDREIDTDNEFVIDTAKTLSSSEYDEINKYAAWISNTFKINCAVVITDNIGKKSAAEYAEEQYKKLYNASNGIMFLINNDTGNDYILRKGAPGHFISDSQIEMLFAEISPMLVTGDYTAATAKVFELFELNLPEFAIDRTNKLGKEEIISLNETLSSACGDGESLAVIFSGGTGEKSLSDYTKEHFQKYYALSSNSAALMVVNTSTAEYYICGHGGFGDAEKNQGSIKDLIEGCLTETDGKKSFNHAASVDIFIKFLGK